MPASILLTGATGFVGGRLFGPLVSAGHAVHCLTRRPEEARRLWPGRSWVGGDVRDPAGLDRALRGCEVAYWLVHGMGEHDPGWAEREVRAASSFADAAYRAGLERIVYLGGVAPAGPPSRHLLARLRTGDALRAGRVPCLELRAGMIVGAGSVSWRIVRDLAARLPAMVLPAWLRHRSEPVAIDDVIAALVAGATLQLPRSRVADLPGPEPLTGKEIILEVAALLGRRPLLLEVPLVTPHLSSLWIRLVTSANGELAAELVEGLTSDLIAGDHGFWRAAGLPPPVPLAVAARRALDEEGPAEGAGAALEALAGLLSRRARR